MYVGQVIILLSFNMFFESLNSMTKIVYIKGSGRSLLLYYKDSFDKEEKEFLKGLFKRYQISIPTEIERKFT